MKKAIAIFLATIFTFAFAGCAQDKPISGTDSAVVDQVLTEEFILRNGKTEYTVIYPENATETEKTAKDDLINTLYESTGVKIPSKTDEGLSHNKTAKYISVGNTTLLESSGVKISEKLQTRNSFQITTQDNIVYIIGEQANAIRYGVFELLFRLVNFEQFSYDCYSLDKCVTDIPLYDYNVLQVPSMPYSQAFTGYMQTRPDLVIKMKGGNQWLSMKGGIAKKGSSGTSHNTLLYIDPDIYYNEADQANYHPKWYAYPNPSQLCYLARGDKEEYQDLLDTFTAELIAQMKIQPGKLIWAISNMDDNNYCKCDECVKLKEKYGCDTAQMYWFVKDLYNNVMAWFETDEGRLYRREFYIDVEHYLAYSEAPAKYNEKTGEWEPIDESVRMPEGITGYFAPMLMNWLKPIDDPVNISYYNQLQKIYACFSQISIWAYSTNFGYYLYPFDVFGSMQRNYQIFYEHGAILMEDETQNGNYMAMTGWHMLSSYLSCKFSWNVYDDQEALIDRFMNGYFMDAAEPMREYFESFRRFSTFQQAVLAKDSGSIYYPIEQRHLWPKVKIDEWHGYLDEAEKRIEKYKTVDYDTYEMLYNHISIERIFLDHVSVQFYSESLGSRYASYVLRYADNVLKHKILLAGEHSTYMPDYVRQLAASVQ